MKHKVKKGRRLGRDRDHRKQLIRNLLTSLIKNQKLETTLAKGKEVKREFDVLVNLAKRSVARHDFSLKRKIFGLITNKQVARSFFDSILASFQDRSSGYLTLERTGRLRNDGAETVALGFVTKARGQSAPTAADPVRQVKTRKSREGAKK